LRDFVLRAKRSYARSREAVNAGLQAQAWAGAVLMNGLLPFIVAGIATGSIYGLAASGLVLTYKTSGIFNFGHGAVAAVAAYAFYLLKVKENIDWKWSFVLSVLILGPLLGWMMEFIGRFIAPQSTPLKVAGTVGIILVVEGLSSIKFGSNALSLPQFLPRGNETFRFGGVNIAYSQVIVTAVAVTIMAALMAMFRYTRLGVAMRGVVDDPDLLSLHATSPRRVRRAAWVIGTTFAALSGVLLAPTIGIQAVALTFLIVQAFGAAAIGYFSSLPLTFAGGMVIAILASISAKYVVTVAWLDGVPASLPFFLLVLVMVILPRRKLDASSIRERRASVQWEAPTLVRGTVGVIVLALLLLVPHVVGGRLPFYTVGLTRAIMLLSLGLLVRTAGMVSLAQAAFAAIGAVAFAQFTANFGIPWFLALLLGALVVVPVAALFALPAIRLSGVFLAVVTLGVGLMIQSLLYSRGFMFTSNYDGLAMPRPSFASSDKSFYFVVVAITVVTVIAMSFVHRSRLGRLLRGVSESPIAVTTMGLNINLTRLIIFCISGFFAGISGILYGASVHTAVSGDMTFAPLQSLILLAVLAIAPFGEPWYAVVAVIGAVVPSYWSNGNAGNWINVIFGFFAVVTALQGGPPTMPARGRELLERFTLSRRRQIDGLQAQALPATASRGTDAHSSEPGLEVRELQVRFSGRVAVASLSLQADMGKITGLIGPNGAGKTTTFNACSGLLRPSAGSIIVHGRNVSSWGANGRARLGLGRTFQITRLCESLTVRENVALGREASMAGSNLLKQFAGKQSDQRLIRAVTDQALEVCGISQLAERQAGTLATSERRLTELARCLAGPFDVLLLDEPSSGLDVSETERFGETLRAVVRERGCAILLVEHDLSLVMGVCDYMYVMDLGALLFSGTPSEVSANSLVQRAYLGTFQPEPTPIEAD
jgi:ABC-type branched-subunit amino acid transport system ATPase component/branched-subunit amino acid ABC-type transport system permease component